MATLGALILWPILGGIIWLFAQFFGALVGSLFGVKSRRIGLGSIIFGFVFFPIFLMLYVVKLLLKQYK